MANGRSREQQLVDICFEIGITIHEHRSFKNMTRDYVTRWIADQLKGCGFPTHPCGGTWGVLEK